MTALAKARWLAAIAAPIAVLAAALHLADAPRHRYGLKWGPCFEAMVFGQSSPIDYVAVGGSRMLTAFDPYLFEREVRAAHGREVVAYNMARSWFGPDYAYPMLRDLLERREVGHVIVMASYQRGDVYNPLAYSIATNRDLIAAVAARPHARVAHLGATVRMFLLRARDVILRRPRRLAPPAGARTCYEGDVSGGTARLRRAQAELVARRGFREVEFDIADPKQEYAVYYYRRMVAAARRHGAEITFVRMPLLAGPRWSDRTARRFEEVVGARLLRLPAEMRVRLALDGYRDEMHLVGPGRERFIAWLVEALHETSAEAGSAR